MLLISKTYWLGLPFAYKGKLSTEIQAEPVQLKAADLRDSNGIYYTPKNNPKPDIGILVTHPRVDFTRHYCVPDFVAAGFACLGLNGRCFNNDAQAIHEQLILDVNAGVKFLRDRGAKKVILFGNSGGGSLSAFFQAQAQLPQGKRIAETPAGDKTKLNDVEMFPADALVLVSAHKGQGLILNECADPAVIDENDPLKNNAELDMYNSENGFKPAPEQSRYSMDFIQKYRAAQLARIERLDNLAREYIHETRQHEQAYNNASNLSFNAHHALGRRAAFEKVMVIYRTMANLHYTDHSIDPSSRAYGSLLSDRPDLMNMQYMGFARVLTPQAWLSTWSGISSNANLPNNLAQLSFPVLVINANKDREIYPGDAKIIWQAVASSDKKFLEFEAEHYFEAEFGAKIHPDVKKVMDEIIPWIKQRFE
jgi:pimeloyl-ACP methyl ester carboxylesterase